MCHVFRAETKPYSWLLMMTSDVFDYSSALIIRIFNFLLILIIDPALRTFFCIYTTLVCSCVIAGMGLLSIAQFFNWTIDQYFHTESHVFDTYPWPRIDGGMLLYLCTYTRFLARIVRLRVSFRTAVWSAVSCFSHPMFELSHIGRIWIASFSLARRQSAVVIVFWATMQYRTYIYFFLLFKNIWLF